ncbi:glycosyltransferase family 2 protein [Paenibacillus pasadenensis]|uniref:4,4'-diaponeurosporenoate glycosyltransferase n=1 Tax=Paenibacillus pasadenensis TaxID=217090 RepID=A0A2N5N715_9BACL|nr:glycosyltransferase [Paenibacillus pasadenensis]PLT46079.1 Glycosyl transferase, family 2 [Paenibacillus pasadenensis]
MDAGWWLTFGLLALGRLLLAERRLTASKLGSELEPAGANESFREAGSSADKEAAQAGRWSVVIPARDEARNLEALLPLLLGQTVQADIVVVDDGSTDGTAAAAAKHAGVRVVPAGSLPAGWRGKNWACSRGAAASASGRIVFLDADARPGPDFLEALSAACPAGTVVTVQPWHRADSLREQLSAMLNAAVIAGSGRFAAWRRVGGPRPGSFGPCLACWRDDYEAAGGHEAVKGEILDHDRLAARFAACGRRSLALLGGERLAFRMYAGGWSEMTAGWSKSIALGAGGTPAAALLLMIGWVSGLAGAAAAWLEQLLAAAAALAQGGLPAAGALSAAALLYALAVLSARRAWKHAGSFGWLAALLYPLPLLYFFAVFALSFYRAFVRRRVSWKGRDLDVA